MISGDNADLVSERPVQIGRMWGGQVCSLGILEPVSKSDRPQKINIFGQIFILCVSLNIATGTSTNP